ncbi:MAG: HTTM domain-containing protein [Myxococcota bacterium]|nr:HTTM domain-containing protein [Myxococcota bacterium]
MTERLRRHLSQPVDDAGLAVFRVGFGLLAAVAAVRFLAHGWVEALLAAPVFHFTWIPGMPVAPAPVLTALLIAQVLAGLMIAVGWRVRAVLSVWLSSFVYIDLVDKALYLNHHVLFVLLGVWLLILPVGRLPRWGLWLLRVQVASVYTWAGVAKLNADWLLRGEPLATWLSARSETPLVGPLLALPQSALAMSWGGMLYDLAVPFLLLHPRTRRLGMVMVVGFHAVVGLLFPIGIFPWLMVLSATLLLSPDWPRRWLSLPPMVRLDRPLSRPGAAMLAALLAAIVLFPGRFLLWGADVSWTERGYRLAWRVMLNEKTGLVDYRVVEAQTGRTWRVMPAEALTPLQHKQMRTQPDMIRDYARHLQRVHAGEGRTVAVYADAWASLNGRPSQRLLRADLDLTAPRAELEAAAWILPLSPLP